MGKNGAKSRQAELDSGLEMGRFTNQKERKTYRSLPGPW
jgi:hypothetical protein